MREEVAGLTERSDSEALSGGSGALQSTMRGSRWKAAQRGWEKRGLEAARPIVLGQEVAAIGRKKAAVGWYGREWITVVEEKDGGACTLRE